jgi:hypothetical protein
MGTLAVRLAGFEIRDQLAWVFGSGFPKSHNIGKAIDKAAGVEREVVGEKIRGDVQKAKVSGFTMAAADANKNNKAIFGYGIENITAPATDDAKKWEGWGTALKPAFEPILLARKPLIGTVVQNVLKHGTGAINIDGCRIEHVTVDNGNIAQNPHLRGKIKGGNGGNIFPTEQESRISEVNPLGRWPANLAHDGSEEVLALFPQSTSTGGSGPASKNWIGDGRTVGASLKGATGGFGDSGSAARFFYCAKASKSDRGEGNIHPTVKPHELMKWLALLITPTGGVILDPFLGSGSTGKASVVEGFNFIGIEMDDAYFDIAKNRILETKTPKLPELPEGFEYE